MWHSIISGLAKIIVIPTIFLMSLAGYNTQVLSPEMAQQMQNYTQFSQENPMVGAVQPFAGGTYNLAGSGVSGSASTVVLTSLTIKQTGQLIQTSDLVGSSGTFYVTIEPGSNTRQEIVGCTGVAQNGSSASLTGCSRGLSPISPYTASTTLQFTHAGGSQVVFSDPPQLFAQYAAKTNNESITGIWSFDVGPIINDTNSTSSSQVATRKFVTDTAFGSTPVLKQAGGTGAPGFSTGGFLYDSGSGTALSASSSPTVGYIYATSTTASSTFLGGAVVGKSLNVSGNEVITGNISVGGSITAGTVVIPALGILGNGTDGNVDQVSNGTSTRDIYAQNFTVESGVIYSMGGFRLFATGTVSVIGTLKNNGFAGGVGANGAGGGGGTAGAISLSAFGSTTPGTAGGAANSGSTNSNPLSWSFGGVGGSGGSAEGGAHTGGAVTPPLQRIQDLFTAMWLSGFSTSTNSLYPFQGGTGGAGGDGGNANSGGGGGGGGGGGIMGIYADTVTVSASGVIQTNGGRGGDGGTTNGCGGGGGGGGFLVIAYKTAYTNSGTVQAAGGTHGTMQGGCTGSADGSVGTVTTFKLQ